MVDPNRVVERFLSKIAAAFRWKEWDDEYTTNIGTINEPIEQIHRSHRAETKTPNGWIYRIEEFVDEWHVKLFKRAGAYHPDAYLTADGAEQRFGKRTQLPSLEVAKRAAEKHYTLATAPKETDPRKLVERLTPDQKAFILEALDNGGVVPADYGTRGEQPIRIRRTRILKQLEPSGIFHGWALTPLGHEVAKLLR